MHQDWCIMENTMRHTPEPSFHAEVCVPDCFWMPVLCAWYPKQPFFNGCLVISNHFLCNDLVHHPIETTIKNWLFGLQGVSYPPWFDEILCFRPRLGHFGPSFVPSCSFGGLRPTLNKGRDSSHMPLCTMFWYSHKEKTATGTLTVM